MTGEDRGRPVTQTPRGVVLKGVEKRFGDVTAVAAVDLEVRAGELLVLVGPSGCGKSTLLRLIAGLEEPTAGEVWIGGRPVNDVAPGDRDVAMVFQSYALYPHMTVAQNLGFGLRVRGAGRAEVAERVERTADVLGLGELLLRRPGQLSGGQQQRVALGRAMVRDPGVFLFDEPLSNLDAGLRLRTRDEIAALHRRLGTTMIFVTHDQVEALSLGQRVAVMDQGRLQQVGTPRRIYRRPGNLFVAGFVGSPPINQLSLARDPGRSPRRRFRSSSRAPPPTPPPHSASAPKTSRSRWSHRPPPPTDRLHPCPPQAPLPTHQGTLASHLTPRRPRPHPTSPPPSCASNPSEASCASTSTAPPARPGSRAHPPPTPSPPATPCASRWRGTAPTSSAWTGAAPGPRPRPPSPATMPERAGSSAPRAALAAFAATILATTCAPPSPTATTLRVALWAGGHELEIEQQVADRYEALHPGVRVLLESAPNGYEERLLTSIAAGHPPDVYLLDSPDIPTFVDRGLATDLAPYQDALGFSAESIFPQVLDAFRRGGAIFALPKDFHADGDLREPRGPRGSGGGDAAARGMDMGRLPRGRRGRHQGHGRRRAARRVRVRLSPQPLPVGAVRVVGRRGHTGARGRRRDGGT